MQDCFEELKALILYRVFTDSLGWLGEVKGTNTALRWLGELKGTNSALGWLGEVKGTNSASCVYRFTRVVRGTKI